MKYMIFIPLLFLAGCVVEKQSMSQNPENSDVIVVDTSSGGIMVEQKLTIATQTVETVSRDYIVTWIKDRPTIIIDSMVSVDYSVHGSCTGFIVIYRDTKVLVEKSAKDTALDKLNDEDKKLLGLK